VTARPGWSAAGALAILALLIVPVLSLNLGEPQATATAATAPASARAGLVALVSSGVGPGVLRPGVLTFVWQEGHGTTALFSSPATGAVPLWVPLAVFALLFGLSMDYEVFILTRINEEYEQTGDVRQAVIRGVLAPALVALFGRAN
jgi:uncharacterized membrane protein YdfJ with MMPL/SSD domain